MIDGPTRPPHKGEGKGGGVKCTVYALLGGGHSSRLAGGRSGCMVYGVWCTGLGGIGRYKTGLTRKGNTDAICGEGARGMRNRSKRDVFGKCGGLCGGVWGGRQGGLGGGVLGGFEFAVDRDVGILVETGIGFHAGFGGGATFDYTEIMTEETKAPFERSKGVVVLESMGDLLGGFDEFAVSYAGS